MHMRVQSCTTDTPRGELTELTAEETQSTGLFQRVTSNHSWLGGRDRAALHRRARPQIRLGGWTAASVSDDPTCERDDHLSKDRDPVAVAAQPPWLCAAT